MNLSTLIALPIGKVLAGGLAVSLAVNVGMGLYAHALRAEAEIAKLNLSIAVDANATGLAARDKAIEAATECAGKAKQLEQDTIDALRARDKAELAAAAARSARARAVREALTDPDCAANALIPVCPGLVGAQ